MTKSLSRSMKLYLLFAFFSILVCIALCNDDNIVSFTQQLVGELQT